MAEMVPRRRKGNRRKSPRRSPQKPPRRRPLNSHISKVKDHDKPNLHELSELMSVKEFKTKIALVHNDICREGLQGVSNGVIQNQMKLSDEEFKQCMESCDPKTLMSEGVSLSVLQRETRYSIPSDIGLESLQDKGQIDVLYPQSSFVPSPSISFPTPQRLPLNHLVPCPEALLTVLVYHPALRRPQLEYLVLGCQRLTELKDILFCSLDYHVTTDCSDNHKTYIADVPNKSKSGYFFINNTFYNDLRDPTAEDYSSTIIDWVESDHDRLHKSPRFDHFKKADMHEAKFEDLSLRLGYPYVYCHHGNCEHGIVFTDLRLLSSCDVQDKRKYPLLVRYWKTHRKKCCVCEEFTACWVTMNDALAAESPAYFCKTCFDLLHYNNEGDKIVDGFSAYPFYDEMTSLLESYASPSEPS